MATIDEVLRDPDTSEWLRSAINTAIKRDPADATVDAECLAHLLRDRLVALQRQHKEG